MIQTKSGKQFASSSSDWRFWHDDAVVPNKLRELDAKGFRIVVFTNQGGVEAGHTSVKELQTKFTAIANKLDLPIVFLAATEGDKYKKPMTGMWDYF